MTGPPSLAAYVWTWCIVSFELREPMEILLSFFILMCGATGLLMGNKLAKAKARRIEKYRASAESHILNLHD
jgi:hypothetical protein